MTPLFIACQNGHVDVVLALLEKARGTILVNQVGGIWVCGGMGVRV